MNPAQQYQMIEMTSPDDEGEEDDNSSEVRAKHNEKYDTPKLNRQVGQILTMGIVIAIGFVFVLFVFTFV